MVRWHRVPDGAGDAVAQGLSRWRLHDPRGDADIIKGRSLMTSAASPTGQANTRARKQSARILHDCPLEPQSCPQSCHHRGETNPEFARSLGDGALGGLDCRTRISYQRAALGSRRRLEGSHVLPRLGHVREMPGDARGYDTHPKCDGGEEHGGRQLRNEHHAAHLRDTAYPKACGENATRCLCRGDGAGPRGGDDDQDAGVPRNRRRARETPHESNRNGPQIPEKRQAGGADHRHLGARVDEEAAPRQRVVRHHGSVVRGEASPDVDEVHVRIARASVRSP